ncbi:plasmid stabilization system [Candidatus Magnetoovum chiemensis]|nr:plasmid stabilization system [Candidatus Magnetoovum chiemensis]
MAWQIEIKPKAFKFFETQDNITQNRLKQTLSTLIDYLDAGIMPFKEMDIKRLSGEKEGFMRLRVGTIRLIFKLDINYRTLKIYAAGYRGDIYK